MFLSSFQVPTLERVRASASTPHPHPPVKVVKPNWGVRLTPTLTDSEPSLKATWLGHVVRPQVAPSTCTLITLLTYILIFIAELLCHDWPTRRTRSRLVRRHLFGVRWPVFLGRHPTAPYFSLHSTGTPRFPIRDLLPQPVRSPRNLPLCNPVKSQIYTYDHLDLPTLQQIHDLCGENVHFLVPLGNKTWFKETGIPTSQVTELDW